MSFRTNVLTINTPIPTSLRGKVRALVKSYPGWQGFLIEKAIISASARNVDLIEFTLRHPTLKAQIEQMLTSYAAAAPVTAGGDTESAAVLMQIAKIEKLLHEFYQRFPQQKPRIRVQAVLQAL